MFFETGKYQSLQGLLKNVLQFNKMTTTQYYRA